MKRMLVLCFYMLHSGFPGAVMIEVAEPHEVMNEFHRQMAIRFGLVRGYELTSYAPECGTPTWRSETWKH